MVLASSSPARKIILEKLGISFKIVPPNIDESRQKNETAEALVKRLAMEKTRTIAQQERGIIIASDQVARVHQHILTKPQKHQNAVQQLQYCSGRWVDFFTSLTLINTQNKQKLAIVDKTQVLFRPLSLPQIEHYLLKEQPYQCAGSFKSESLGITLVQKIKTNDINALMGLPLIALVDMLLSQGIELP